jgi:hypothetical protein
MIELLCKKGELKGKLAKGTFTPASYNKLQDTTVVQMFRQNDYLELNLLQKL